MIKKIIFYSLFLTITVSAKAQLDTIPLTFGNKLTLASKTLKEEANAWIRFPSDFEEVKDSLSLLVLLDGDEYFKMASDVVELYEWSEKMPKTVIVGLLSTTESRWKYYTPSNVAQTKEMDQEDNLLYTNSGNFEKYADFIATELIPVLSKELEVDFLSKTIFGHSNGGLGVMSFYVLRSEIFDKYIAASPAMLWDDYYLQKKLKDDQRNNSLYITLATKGRDYPTKSFEKLNGNLKKTNSNFLFKENKQETHSTNGLRTLLDGLEFVYKKN